MILARISRDSARKVLFVTIMSVGMMMRFGHDLKEERIDVLLEAGVATYFEPIQFRDPVENGRKASFSSLSKRESYSG